MGGIWPGGGYFGEYSPGGSPPAPGSPITFTDFLIVDAEERWVTVEAQGRWFIVSATEREFDV